MTVPISANEPYYMCVSMCPSESNNLCAVTPMYSSEPGMQIVSKFVSEPSCVTAPEMMCEPLP